MEDFLHQQRGDSGKQGTETATLDSDETRRKIGKGFSNWQKHLKRMSIHFEGTIFVCDVYGQLVAKYNFNDEQDQWENISIGKNAVGQCLEQIIPVVVTGSEHDSPELHPYDTMAVPVFEDSECSRFIAVLGLLAATGQVESNLNLLKSFGFSFQSFLFWEELKLQNEQLVHLQKQVDNEAKKRDLLFEVSKKLHAKIDVDSVLSEIVKSLEQTYPAVTVELYLSQDNPDSSLHVKPLVFNHSEDDLCTQAYIEGHVVAKIFEDGSEIVAAPLNGKQAVYGVVQLIAKEACFNKLDVRFITMLADTAGSAFENASLYEQSNLLINELRLINEITKRLNQSLKVNDIFNFASTKLLSIFNADYSCILQVDKEHNKLVVQASNLPAMVNEDFPLDYGFSGLVYSTKEPLIVSDYLAQPVVKSKLMDLTDSRSLITSPIIVDSDVVGVVLMTAKQPHFFSYENYKLLQVLASHIGLAISNASLHAAVRRMVITDNLTGLHARHYLDEQVNFLQKKDFCGSLIVSDIDNFKKVNDTYGHQIGDQILIQVSNIIRTSIRGTDIAARWGGEELAIYLPQSTVDHTIHVAERIRRRVEQETSPKVTVSCGISDWNWEDEKISVESLFYKADMALYEAKHSGKNLIRTSSSKALP